MPSTSRALFTASPRRRLAACLLLASSLLGWSCSDSPTEPTDSFTFSGTVERQDVTTENFTMTVDGLMEIRLDTLIPQGPDGTVISADALAIGFSLGRQIGEFCDTSGAVAFRVGDSASYGLDQGAYCLYFYDIGFIPVDVAYDFTVTVDMTDF